MRTPSRQGSLAASLFELFSSMRFAISLLTLLSIASVVGTVLRQNEPYPYYVVEFGQFWFTAFEWLGLFDVYHSAWFLTILAFLVLSTSLCIWRNTPGFIKDMKGFREKASDSSLAAMSHSELLDAASLPAEQAGAYLRQQGFQVRQVQREDGVLVAAKKGAANKLGYFLAHIAMVVICLGGLLDGNLPLKVGELLGKVVPETRDIPQSQIPPQSRLSIGNLSFRGNVTIPENRSADVVFLNAGKGYLVQDLPFAVTLKKFHVDYYSTGMPKLFASDLVVTDKQTGKETVATVKVNHPLIVDGVAIYQASFGDGGSPLRFKAWNWEQPQADPLPLDGKSMGSQPLLVNGKRYQLEFGELRVFNIENLGKNAVMGVNQTFQEVMQNASQVKHEKQLKNLGPSITYKLRDSQGQAREFHSYMAPMMQDGQSYLVTGVRSEVAEPFAYLRLPLDEQGSIHSFMRLRTALLDSAIQREVARRVAEQALAGQAIGRDMRGPFEQSVRWVLDRFGQGGFAALEKFMDERVPKDKRQEVAQTYVKIVQGAVVEVDALARAKAGLPRQAMTERHYRFLLDSLVATSATFDYGSPLFLQLDGFDEVKASGLQITRSPGKTIVYLGSMLLVLGIICMFYIRELRIWVLIKPDQVRVAMASNRKTSDLDRDFTHHRNALQQLARGE